jgi:hypothetical protein
VRVGFRRQDVRKIVSRPSGKAILECFRVREMPDLGLILRSRGRWSRTNFGVLGFIGGAREKKKGARPSGGTAIV